MKKWLLELRRGEFSDCNKKIKKLKKKKPTCNTNSVIQCISMIRLTIPHVVELHQPVLDLCKRLIKLTIPCVVELHQPV